MNDTEGAAPRGRPLFVGWAKNLAGLEGHVKSLTDYDARQLIKMRQIILDYKAEKKSLYGLIGDVEFLIAVLEDVESGFTSILLDEWGRLEIVYAIALDRERKLNSEDLDEIDDAVAKLLEAINSKLVN